MKKQPIAYMLVGIPGSGKSTFVREYLSNIPYVSSDYYLEKWAKERGTTYNDIFMNEVKNSQAEMYKDLDIMIAMKNDFIWDQTNIDKKTRAAKLKKIPDFYRKVAVYFPVDLEVAKSRNAARNRSIPSHVIESMHDKFEIPTLDEGFDTIVDGVSFDKF